MNRRMRRTLSVLLSLGLVLAMSAQALAVLRTAPLLNNTRWGQGNASAKAAYNLYAPQNGSTVYTTAGWMAVAVGQIFNYYGWPTLGNKTVASYTKGGITVPAVTLSTSTGVTGRPYLMANASAMAPLMLNASTNSAYKDSIARMLSDIGAAFGTTYRNATSKAGKSNAASVGSFINGSVDVTPFSNNFYYKNSASKVYGYSYGSSAGARGAGWMKMLEGEVNAGRPVIVRLGNESAGAMWTNYFWSFYPKNYIFVVDGYDKSSTPARVHINWGNGSGGGTNMGWYALNYTSSLPAHLRSIGNVTNMSAVIGIVPKYSNVTLLSPVNASTSSHPGGEAPKTPYVAGPFRFTGATSGDYNYYELTLAKPGTVIASGSIQYWPASYCNSSGSQGKTICDALLHPNYLWTTGLYKWRVRGLNYDSTAGTVSYGPYTNVRSFNATVSKTLRLRTPNGSVTATPTYFTWFRVPGATFYKFELFKGTDVQYALVSGTSGHPALQYWYNASGHGASNASVPDWGGQDVDCSTDANVCSLPWSAITNGATVELTTESTTANTGLGNYWWRVTPFGAGAASSNSSSFYLNGTNAKPKAPALSCPHTPDITKPGSASSLASRCNVTSASPSWGWPDTTNGANDGYEIAYGLASANLNSYFRGYVLRNSSKFIDYYSGVTYSLLPNATAKTQTGPCADGYCNASIGNVAVSGSILLNTGKYNMYARAWAHDSNNNWLPAGDWSNFTFYVAAPTLGKVGNTTPAGALTRGGGVRDWKDRQMFYPRVEFNGARNASWYGVEFKASSALATTTSTFTQWFSKRQICNNSDTGARPRCWVNATTVSNTTAYLGLKPSFTYTIYPYAPGRLSDYASYKKTNATIGSTIVPGTPGAISPISYSSTPGTYSWNSSLSKGNSTYFEMYICKKNFTDVNTQCPYHDFLPVDGTTYAATNNTATRTSYIHGTPAVSTSVSGNTWVYSVTINDSNMSKGADSGSPWNSGQYIWGVRGINPNGYNSGSGYGQWGLGNFTKQ